MSPIRIVEIERSIIVIASSQSRDHTDVAWQSSPLKVRRYIKRCSSNGDAFPATRPAPFSLQCAGRTGKNRREDENGSNSEADNVSQMSSLGNSCRTVELTRLRASKHPSPHRAS